VGGVDVERFAERLLGDLPVGLDDLRDVGLHVAVAQVPAVEVGGQLPDELLEGLSVRIGVDEDEPVPRPDLDFGQVEALIRHVRKVPLGGDVLQAAIEVPGEAVERAADLRAVAVVLLQLTTAVQAGVREGLDGVRRRPHDDVRPADDVVHGVITDPRDVLLAAGELPHPGPQPLLLQVVPLPRDVMIDRQVLVAEEPRRLLTQDLGDLVGIGVEQLLIAHAGGAGCPLLCGTHW